MFRTLFVTLTAAMISCGTDIRTDGGGPSGGRPAARIYVTTPIVKQASGGEYYASPIGKAKGKGNRKKPWDLATALGQTSIVKPGDTIWLLGGSYSGSFISNLRGTPNAPIIVRQYPNERATIDGDITLNGQYTVLWGFEIKNSNPVPPEVMAINNKCPGSKLINLVIHDSSGNGIGTWEQAPDSEVYGCLLQYCGVQGSSAGRHAHGIYVQNLTGTKEITDNIIIDTYGYGIHAYGSAAALNDIVIEGNIVVRSGLADILLQGGKSMIKPVVKNNMTYRDDGRVSARFDAGLSATTNLTLIGNHLTGGMQCWGFPSMTFRDNILVQRNQLIELIMPPGVSPSTYDWDDNVYKQIADTPAHLAFVVDLGSGNITYDFNAWKSTYGRDTNATYQGIGAPTGTVVYVQPNKYERGRANIVVYNWDHERKVKVDLSSVLSLGAAYEVRSAQDFLGEPIKIGTFSGEPIRLPMTNMHIAKPAGGNEGSLEATAPEFNVFILRSL